MYNEIIVILPPKYLPKHQILAKQNRTLLIWQHKQLDDFRGGQLLPNFVCLRISRYIFLKKRMIRRLDSCLQAVWQCLFWNFVSLCSLIIALGKNSDRNSVGDRDTPILPIPLGDIC